MESKIPSAGDIIILKPGVSLPALFVKPPYVVEGFYETFSGQSFVRVATLSKSEYDYYYFYTNDVIVLGSLGRAIYGV